VRVPGVCAWPVSGVPKLASCAAYNSGPRPPQCWAHESRRRLVRLVPPVPGLWLCFTHAACVCNDMVSAANRVVGVTPLPTRRGLVALRAEARRLANRFPRLGPWSREEVLAHFSSKRRKRYEGAAVALDQLPLTRKFHGRIHSFVKAEKFNPAAKVNPDPRMIQARSPEYGLEVARFLKPIEHHLYSMRSPNGSRMVAKGLNQRARAELLERKMRLFRRPVVFSLDCSRWDKHVVADVLQVEHSFYLMILADPVFQRLLSWQLDNRCVTANSVRYRVAGGRMSGDMNTALGNCLLMVLMVHAAMRQVLGPGRGRWDLLDDGDDCLVIVDERDFELAAAQLPDLFLTFGQELKVENVARDIRDVTFCQCRVVETPTGPIFTRDWRKVLSQSACGVKHWGEPKMVRPMLSAVGMCELALARGLPVLQAFAMALIRNGRGEMPRRLDVDEGLAVRVKYEHGISTLNELRALKPEHVTDGARHAFARTWGCSIEQQLHIEDILNGWVVHDVVAVDFPDEWDSTWRTRVALENELPSL
jgi:hypothetical protein